MGRGPGQGARATRRDVLLAARVAAAGAAGLAACAARTDAAPEQPLAPIAYGYLTPLPVDVATIEVSDADPPPVPGDVGAAVVPRPAEAVRTMARDRLSAAGGSGRAFFTVTRAAMTRLGGGGTLACALACRLDVSRGLEGEEGSARGFVDAEARAAVSGTDAARPGAADRLLRRVMDGLNVEFEYQLRRNLRGWLVSAAPLGAAGAGVATPSGEVAREELPRS